MKLIRVDVSRFQDAPAVSGLSQEQVDLPPFPAVVGYLFWHTYFDIPEVAIPDMIKMPGWTWSTTK